MKKKLIIRQEEISDCGACSLLSIIRYYGSNASLENIRMFSLTNHTGVNALNLINCAKRYGFDAKGLRIDSFKNIKFPIIAHVNINKSLSHFVVIYEELNTCFEVMDPAYGHRTINKSEFMKIFSGNVIILHPKILVKEKIDNKIMLRKIIKTYKDKLKHLVIIAFFLLLVLLCTIIYDLYLNISLTFNGGVGLLCLFIFILIFKETLNYYISNKECKLIKYCSNELLNDFFIHIFKLPLKYIHLKDPGEILKRANELESISEYYIEYFLNIITNLIIIIPIFYVLIRLNLLSFVLTLICSIFYILYVIYSNRNIKELIDSTITSSTNYSMIVNNYLSGLISIKHVNNTRYFIRNIKSACEQYFKDDSSFRKYLLKNVSIKKTIILSFELLNLYLLLNEYYSNSITIELLIAINTLSMSSLNCINSIADGIPNFLYYRKLVNRVNDFYNLEEDISCSRRLIGGGIYCRDLSFSYNGVDSVINNISFTISCNDKVFIKGASGSGKSTICRILNKDLTDYKGVVRYSGKNLNDLSAGDISNVISYCSQSEVLFTGTIKENILLGRKITEERFNEIIRICNLEQVIKHKPFAYDTYLYGDGNELSGGEKNLILLARCLVVKKPIYILDEVLANVDEKVEIEVIQNLLSFLNDSIVIYVSHRDKSSYFNRVLNV